MKRETLMEYKIVEKPAFTFADVSKRVQLQFEGVNNDILKLAQSITEEQSRCLSHLRKWTKKNLTMHTVKSGFRS